MNRPRILIAMATDILGGPGKGLVQFLRHGGMEGCHPVIIDYRREGFEGLETEFEQAIKATGAQSVRLKQRGTIDPGMVNQALEAIREHGITLLQSHGYKSHVLCWMLRRKTGLPWLAFVHGWTRENMRMRLYTGIEHMALLTADEVVAVSESLRSRLLAPARKRCRVIPNALAPGELITERSGADVRAELKMPLDAVVAGIVGRLSPEKGHKMFLHALAGARQHDPLLWGLIVGDGQERAALENEAKKLGIETACVFTGHVKDTAAFYSAMDMLVLASLTEGMPNVALEGMHMGLAVIATQVGGIPEVVEKDRTGILISPGDEQAMTAAMLELAASRERRETMGKAGKERICRSFDPRVRTGRILELYQTILSSKGRTEARI